MTETSMKLYTLGTSHGGTEPGRSCSGNLLQFGNDFYLFDCGGDIEHIMTDMNLPVGKIKAVFISHMHVDHTANLPSLAKCFTCGYTRMDTSLQIFMPSSDGIDAFKAWLRCLSLNPDSEKLFINHYCEGVVYSDENVTVSAVRTEHLDRGQKPSYAFTVTSRDGKSLLYTGDLNCDFHDYPQIVFQRDFDLVLSELVHFNVEKNLDTIVKSRTKKLVFTHLSPQNIPIINSVSDRFPFEVLVAYDGMTVEF